MPDITTKRWKPASAVTLYDQTARVNLRVSLEYQIPPLRIRYKVLQIVPDRHQDQMSLKGLPTQHAFASHARKANLSRAFRHQHNMKHACARDITGEHEERSFSDSYVRNMTPTRESDGLSYGIRTYTSHAQGQNQQLHASARLV